MGSFGSGSPGADAHRGQVSAAKTLRKLAEQIKTRSSASSGQREKVRSGGVLFTGSMPDRYRPSARRRSSGSTATFVSSR